MIIFNSPKELMIVSWRTCPCDSNWRIFTGAGKIWLPFGWWM